MRIIKIFLILLIVLITYACTPTTTLKANNYKNFNSYSFILIDDRPQHEKEDEILSLSITNCAYGIYRIGDDDTQPERITYLKNTLQQHRSGTLKGHTIRLKKFTVHKNLQTTLRRSNPIGGLVAGTLSATECFAKTNEPGGFSRNENPNLLPIAIVEITFEIAGRQKSMRIVHTSYSSDHDELISSVMGKAMQQVLKTLKA